MFKLKYAVGHFGEKVGIRIGVINGFGPFYLMAKFIVKNGHKNDMCYDEIGLCAQI